MMKSNLNRFLSPTGRKIVNLWKKNDKDFRDGFVEEGAYSVFADQVKEMRSNRGWSQAQLAEKAGTFQPAISEIENPTEKGYTISTLLKVASAFDVALSLKMVPYSEYVYEITGKQDYNVKSFDEDDFALEPDFLYENWTRLTLRPSAANDTKCAGFEDSEQVVECG